MGGVGRVEGRRRGLGGRWICVGIFVFVVGIFFWDGICDTAGIRDIVLLGLSRMVKDLRVKSIGFTNQHLSKAIRIRDLERWRIVRHLHGSISGASIGRHRTLGSSRAIQTPPLNRRTFGDSSGSSQVPIHQETKSCRVLVEGAQCIAVLCMVKPCGSFYPLPMLAIYRSEGTSRAVCASEWISVRGD
ncbi:hypothetical protein DFH07DRAFT_863194 [Mycena maculata]|uniref:Uncharacterized protein n=1 Tax=Mycena maculata TaxID=230809 RepID=A0AAD7H9F4_9AGAR|nr:hypothetical protein DFH07DRAFT_863194 [Mycena maculata]